MTIQELRELALHSVRGTAPANFSLDHVNEAVRDGFKELAGNYYDFVRNQNDIFEIIGQAADEYVPKRVIQQLGMFAEVKVAAQGEKPLFYKKLGRQRAKSFLTSAALSGVYETFRLDQGSFTIPINAVGAAGTLDFERMLDGYESLADLMEVILESLVDAVFIEVQKALVAAASESGENTNRATNVVSTTSFDPTKMVKLLNVARAYGGNPTIFAAPEFIAAMGPDAIVPTLVNVSTAGGTTTTTNVAQGVYPQADIDAIHRTGRISIFRGAPVVALEQSFVDETNTKTWINPQFAYILPTGQEKVVKVVLEGDTIVRHRDNLDNSMEIHYYKKMGAAILSYNNWCIYQNTTITDTSDHPYGI